MSPLLIVLFAIFSPSNAFTISSRSSSYSTRTVTSLFESPQEFIEEQVKDNDIVIFSKTYCPFCKTTKQIFSDLGTTPAIFELDQMSNGVELQDALLVKTGQKTVPNVWVKGEHVGGNDDTKALLLSGKLKDMLQ